MKDKQLAVCALQLVYEASIAGLGVALGVGLGACEMIGSPGASMAERQHADQIAREVTRLAPDPGAARLAIAGAADAMQAHGEDLRVTIPRSSSGWIEVGAPDTTDGSGLRIGLPAEDDARRAIVSSDGTVTFQDAIAATDVAVQPFDRGVRIQTVMYGPGAPTELRYPLDVPDGGRIVSDDEGGLLVLDDAGTPRGGLAAPWARDHRGRAVATRYEVHGTTVVQVVDHRGAGHEYPVVADPWLWIDLIDKATWSSGKPGQRTLEVVPTRWARANAGNFAVGVADWNELYGKYKRRGLTRNLASMKEQLICHQVVVAIVAPDKPSWNLDEWRPEVGYERLVQQRCNPGANAKKPREEAREEE